MNAANHHHNCTTKHVPINTKINITKQNTHQSSTNHQYHSIQSEHTSNSGIALLEELVLHKPCGLNTNTIINTIIIIINTIITTAERNESLSRCKTAPIEPTTTYK
jgi:hypothetical protein